MYRGGWCFFVLNEYTLPMQHMNMKQKIVKYENKRGCKVVVLGRNDQL